MDASSGKHQAPKKDCQVAQPWRRRSSPSSHERSSATAQPPKPSIKPEVSRGSFLAADQLLEDGDMLFDSSGSRTSKSTSMAQKSPSISVGVTKLSGEVEGDLYTAGAPAPDSVEQTERHGIEIARAEAGIVSTIDESQRVVRRAVIQGDPVLGVGERLTRVADEGQTCPLHVMRLKEQCAESPSSWASGSNSPPNSCIR